MLFKQSGNDTASMAGQQLGMHSWTRLPQNQLEPLKRALVDWGPVAVSISCGHQWDLYSTGILDTCVRNAIVDHAVMLSGYGQSGTTKYWLLQNSWGPEWGEQGMIRILRLQDSEEAEFCGIDDQPEVGSGCKGGPSQVRVCGSCGILYDTLIPHFSGSSFLATMMAVRRQMVI